MVFRTGNMTRKRVKKGESLVALGLGGSVKGTHEAVDAPAVPGSDEAVDVNLDYLDSDALEPLGCLGVLVTGDDLHWL